MSEDFTHRFTGRASVYAMNRPEYPRKLLDILTTEIGFDQNRTIADIGSGTGLLSRLFLQNGNRVFCVEPNDEMRSFAEQSLSGFSNFVSVKGRAEDTTLVNASVDLVTVGQALHWFEHQRAKKEFDRILRYNGGVCIVYNDRSEKDPFMREYDALIQRHARDRAKVPEINNAFLSSWFRNGIFKQFNLVNEQFLDLEGLSGRITSASYMPNPSENEKFTTLKNDISQLFQSRAERGRVRMLYDTRVFLGKI
jgi:ubiquinone/menaquinone biosynthesis C-methylase UbiE